LTIFSPEFLPTYQLPESGRILQEALSWDHKKRARIAHRRQKACLAKVAIYADNVIQKVVCSDSSYIM
jgi:hypothetical protein